MASKNEGSFSQLHCREYQKRVMLIEFIKPWLSLTLLALSLKQIKCIIFTKKEYSTAEQYMNR